MTEQGDTIFALSSGHPPAAIGVIRISGPRAGAALRALIGREIAPRRAAFAVVRDPHSGEPIDEALTLWFPGPQSETGEDTAELHIHGGRAVIAATLAALGKVEGLRGAEAGEFTRRAFENGRIDLTAVEGLADLVGAETEAQRRQAFGQLRGVLGKRAATWRERIVAALASIEAGLDFSDEGDVPANLVSPALETAASIRDEIEGGLADSHRGERLREGFTIAIAGPVNAGKSTLFNQLAGRDAAIVSPYPGTTRDVLELHLDLGGYPVTVLDMAGVREAHDPVEQEGIRRAQTRAAQADLMLWVEEVHAPAAPPDGRTGVWRVVNKCDLIDSDSEQSAGAALHIDDAGVFAISAQTGQGLDRLLESVQAHVAASFGGGEPAVVTRARHRDSLEAARAALDRCVAAGPGRPEELIAEDLRLAARALELLLGRVDVDDVLDVIFRDFCIGK